MTAQEMVLKNHNVTNLNNTSLSSIIQIYLDRAKEKSQNTYKNYIRYFNEFFMFVYGKDYSQLTWDDLYNEEKLNDNTIEAYQLYFCKEKGDSANYINSKLGAIKGLFNYLATKKQGKDIDTDIFDIDGLDAKPNSYDPFSDDEIEKLIEFAKTQYHGDIQSLVFETFYRTGLRKSAVLNMKWENIKQQLDIETNQMVWCIVTKNKRNKYPVIPIPDDFYQKLYNVCVGEKVFNICDKSLYVTIDKFCEEYGIDRSQRRLSIHSIRKSGANRVFVLHGIKAAQEFLDHEHISTTGDIYLNNNASLTSKPSFLMGKEIDLSVLKGLGEDGLIELISRCSIVVQNEIVQKVGK